MGVNYGRNRDRLTSFKNPGDLVSYSLGQHSLNWEKFDEQIIADIINEGLDKQQAKIDAA